MVNFDLRNSPNYLPKVFSKLPRQKLSSKTEVVFFWFCLSFMISFENETAGSLAVSSKQNSHIFHGIQMHYPNPFTSKPSELFAKQQIQCLDPPWLDIFRRKPFGRTFVLFENANHNNNNNKYYFNFRFFIFAILVQIHCCSTKHNTMFNSIKSKRSKTSSSVHLCLVRLFIFASQFPVCAVRFVRFVCRGDNVD